jgi:hypothetical protein
LACDLGLECDASGKCLPANCAPGQPGCVCKNGACDGERSECVAGENICRTKSTCTAGEPGCECDGNGGCSGGASCTEGQCVLDGNCNAGEPGCACGLKKDECIGEGFVCDPLALVCLAPRCQPGSPGCRCHNDGTCKVGFQCNLKVGVCSMFECPLGEPGCQCTADGNCNKQGFNCVQYSTKGDSRCVAEYTDSCGPQADRCNRECGAGNVAICPPCDYMMVQCRFEPKGVCDRDPFSPACVSANAMVASVLAVLVAIAALF